MFVMSSMLMLSHCLLNLPLSPLPFLQSNKFLERVIGYFLNCNCRDQLWMESTLGSAWAELTASPSPELAGLNSAVSFHEF